MQHSKILKITAGLRGEGRQLSCPSFGLRMRKKTELWIKTLLLHDQAGLLQKWKERIKIHL
jgi:hypothetical protein